jgi:hypothetical protein
MIYVERFLAGGVVKFDIVKNFPFGGQELIQFLANSTFGEAASERLESRRGWGKS